MSAPVKGELGFFDNRLRWFPSTTTAGTSAAVTLVDANLSTTYPARKVLNCAYTVTAATGSSYFEYEIQHADENDNGSSLPYITGYTYNNKCMRGKLRFRLGETVPPTTQNTRTKIFHLRDTSGNSMMNIGCWGSLAGANPVVRVFTDSGTGGSTTSNTFNPGEFRASSVASASIVELDFVWKSATAAGGDGICKVWWNGNLVANVTNHNCDATPARFWLGIQSAGNQTQTAVLQAINWAHDDSQSTDAIIGFSEYAEEGRPGSFWVCDVKSDSIVIGVWAPKTIYGWSNIYAKVQYDPVLPAQWNGTPSETSVVELIEADNYVEHFTLSGLDSDQAYSFKVVFQDDPVTPTESITQATALGPIYTPPEDSVSKPVDIYSYFCSQQDGFSQPQYGLELISDLLQANASAYSLLWWGEDVVYSDSRDTQVADADVDVYNLPDNLAAAGTMSATSPVGLIDLHAENLASPGFYTLCARIPTFFGYGDHQFHNSYNPSTWPGSGTAAPAPFTHLTRGNVHSRGRACIETLLTPGMLNEGASTETYRHTRIGKVLLIHLDCLRYRTNSTWLGSTQLSWAINVASTTDASDVVILCPQPLGDLIFKEGQDCEDDTDWQDDRNDLFDAIQNNSNVKRFGIIAGDAHIIAGHTRFKSGYSRTWSKFVGEFILGPATNNMLSTAILGSFAFPDAPGTPMDDADFDALASESGVLFFDRLSATGDGAGSPGYMRAFGRITIDPSTGVWRVRVYSARYVNAPSDPLLYDQDFVPVGGGGRIRGRFGRSR